MTDENPYDLNFFIIINYIEYTHDLVDAFNISGLILNNRLILDSQIFTERFEFVYSQISDIFFKFYKYFFIRINFLTKIDDDF
jgi:hypothetical protein